MIFHESHIIAMKDLHFSPHNNLNPQVVSQETLHHNQGQIRHGDPLLPPPKNLEDLRSHVFKKELRKHRRAGSETVLLHPEEANHHHGSQLGILAEKAEDRVRRQERDGPENPPGFESDEHEIGKEV